MNCLRDPGRANSPSLAAYPQATGDGSPDRRLASPLPAEEERRVGDISCPQGAVRLRRLRRDAWPHLGHRARCFIARKPVGAVGQREKAKSARDSVSSASKRRSHIHKDRQGRVLAGHEFRATSVANDTASVVKPCRYAFRSFDRQWIIPDKRLINRPNPTLWSTHSDSQIYLTAPEDRTPTAGPAASFSELIPDLHHYHGRGGRVFPLWRDAGAKHPNIKPAFLSHLVGGYEAPVAAEDVMAYLAAVLCHPDFPERFAKDLKQPGLRVPITADRDLFSEAVALGREVSGSIAMVNAWFMGPKDRPKGPPRLEKRFSSHRPQRAVRCPDRRLRCRKP